LPAPADSVGRRPAGAVPQRDRVVAARLRPPLRAPCRRVNAEKDAARWCGAEPKAQNAAIRMNATKNSRAPSTGNHSGVGDSSGARVSSAGSSG
jgi:hypothetical protein